MPIKKYSGTNPPINDISQLRGREAEMRELEDHVLNRRSVMILGPEGIGKSSLLNCFFNARYRRKMAVDHHLLIRVTDYPVDRDADGVYQYLTDGVLRAVDILDSPETEAIYMMMRKKCIKQKEETTDAASQFQAICEEIQELGFHIMLVIDGFERFVSSPVIKMEHHDLLNALIAKNMSFVVATNYDFNKASLPTSVSGSFLLQKFSDNKLPLKGLSEESCALLVDNGDFSQEQIHQLWILSGGNPAIFRRAAERAFELRPSSSEEWKDVFIATYEDTQALLKRWCKLLSAYQVLLLNKTLSGDQKTGISIEDNVEKTAAAALVDRGLLVHPKEKNTNIEIPDLFKFSTPLLRRYCSENSMQAESMAAYQENEASQAEDALRSSLERVDIDERKVIDLYRVIAATRNLPMPINFQDAISDSDLQEFEISRELFDILDPEVQAHITDGIHVERTLAGVDLMDFSPCYIAFAKAAEVHLNRTLLPVMKLIKGNTIIRADGGERRIDQVEHVMIGNIKYVLSQEYTGTGGSYAATAGQYCMRNLKSFPENWWKALSRSLEDIHTSRNHIPHSGYFSSEEGKKFLSDMFGGTKCVFLRCQNVYEVAVQRGLLPK